MQTLPILMLLTLVAALLAGYPVAFTLGGVALLFGMLGLGPDFFSFLPMRVWGQMTSFILVAVPLFVFMGVTLERSGLAEDLLESMALLFGRMRGGLGVSVIIVGVLLGASTGIIGATVVTMGMIALPVMLRRGYQKELATGTISAAATLGQIIPPSIVLIVLGNTLQISIGELFAGAVFPGLMLCALYTAYVCLYTYCRPDDGPAVPMEEHAASVGRAFVIRIVLALAPPAVLIVAVLGSIFLGIASPTEASAVGAFAAIILAVTRRKLSWRSLTEVVIDTTRLSSMIFTILIGATAFGLVFRGLGGDLMVRSFLLEFGGGYWGVLAIVMLALFVMGFFLDFIEITFIVIPILAPIIKDLGINPLWFAILLAVNFQTSFLTPPMGFTLFYLKGVCPSDVSTEHLYRGVIPFVILQLIGLVLMLRFPGLATWLPGRLFN